MLACDLGPGRMAIFRLPDWAATSVRHHREGSRWIWAFAASGRWSAAASKGLGRGCAEALAEAGVDLVLNARGAEALEATAATIRARHQVNVTTVAADITTEAGRAAVLARQATIDILVTNAGGPPPGLWSDWARDDFIRALDANMLTPIALMTALLPGMIGAGLGPGGQHHLAVGQGADRRSWACRTRRGPG